MNSRVYLSLNQEAAILIYAKVQGYGLVATF